MNKTVMKRYPFQDPSLPIGHRVDDLVSRMTVEEKAGLMFQSMTAFGPVNQSVPDFGLESLESMITNRHMTYFNMFGSGSTGHEIADWYNSAQELAMRARLPIPLTISSDPRNGFTDNPGTMMMSGPFSQWPESLGLAALRSAKTVRRFADIVRREYLAVGLRAALHPQADVMTEARWSRCNGTFGEDADLVSEYTAEYIMGLQGDSLGKDSVAAMVKHFPGGGPEKDGEDPHFEYGKDQIYPGNNLSYHLKPFQAAIQAGVTQVMPSYGRPVGTQYEEVGFAFNKGVLTDLLRNKLGFDGIICTDWGVLNDATVAGQFMPARAWGLEKATPSDRMLKAIEAGSDQFGGESCTDLLIDLIRSGKVREARIDISVRKLLKEKFELGLFDDPFVDEEAADAIVGCKEFCEAGLAAQRESLTLLQNGVKTGGRQMLPLDEGMDIYIEGVDPKVASEYANIVDSPQSAQIGILRIKAPYEHRQGGFEKNMHAGSLEFPADQLRHCADICSRIPTVIDVYMDRPAILKPLSEICSALIVDYGACDQAVLDVLFGRDHPRGRLPFDIPNSMEAIKNSCSDVPFDTKNPTYRYGDGLDYMF